VCVPGETPLPELGLRVTATVGPGIVKPRPARVGKLPARASLSLAGLGRRKLFVRTWRNGDRMRPFGLRGSKKLQDIFVDARVPADERARVPLFECGGEIVWLPGYRIAQGWEVADPADRALQLAVEPLG